MYILERHVEKINSLSLHLLVFSSLGWGTSTSDWPTVPAPDDRWWVWSSRWNENWQGKPKYCEKTCPSATMSTRNPTWPDLGSNPGRRGGKPAPNSLNYGTAFNSTSFHPSNYLRIELNVFKMVEARCYKPEGRGFESRWDNFFFNWPNPSSRTMALGSTQPLTEMSTRKISGGKGPARKADNLTAICEPTV
jgi:hypothetical protein